MSSSEDETKTSLVIRQPYSFRPEHINTMYISLLEGDRVYTRDSAMGTLGIDVRGINKHYLDYLVDCKNGSLARPEHGQMRNGRVANYNQNVFVLNGQDVLGSQIDIGAHTNIKGLPMILIADQSCDASKIVTPDIADWRIDFVDLVASEKQTHWHEQLGLEKNPAGFGQPGSGFRSRPSPKFPNVTLFDALRQDPANTRNLIQTSSDEIADSAMETMSVIRNLLNLERQPKVIVIKCHEGKDRSTAFTLLYTVAWLHKYKGIQVTDAQFRELAFLIETLNGPGCSADIARKFAAFYQDGHTRNFDQPTLSPQAFLNKFYAILDAPVKQQAEVVTAPNRDGLHVGWATDVPQTPKPNIVKLRAASEYYPYPLGKPGRWHFFTVTRNIGAFALTNDELKAGLLRDYKAQLESATDLTDLNKRVTDIEKSDDYTKGTKVGTGLVTRLFKLKTSSQKAFEQMCVEARDSFKPR